MRELDISPNQRFAFGGKTRSGKTRFAMVLSSILVPLGNADWETWWIDTKGDPKDVAALGEWGYQDSDQRSLWGRKSSNHKLFKIRGKGKDRGLQAQEVIERGYNKGGVLLIVDEYRQVVKSRQDPGDALLDVFQRGGGMDVGVLGLTQEPVYIPRELFSQATHMFLFSVSYPYDVDYFETLYEDYVNPISEKADPKGFFHVAVDVDGKGAYYSHQKEWFLKTMKRKEGSQVD